MMTTIQVQDYINNLKTLFKQHANPILAEEMQKYLKDNFEFYGIRKPERALLTKHFYSQGGLISISDLTEIVQELYEQPQRELHYFAIDLAWKLKPMYNEDTIELIEWMITNRSWWDSVDLIASNMAGLYFQKYPKQRDEITQRWIDSGNIWLQRSAIIFQLKYKTNTDTALLSKYILKLTHSKEFFIQKAIGWALREYSKTNPVWVKDFVSKHTLKSLSQREALKIINKK